VTIVFPLERGAMMPSAVVGRRGYATTLTSVRHVRGHAAS
jgi:hypothetical protein